MTNKEIHEFQEEVRRNITALGEDAVLKAVAREFMIQSGKYKYTYNFQWLGRPIVQFPSDIIALQEVIWRVKPSVIVETGVAHGGGVIFHASMLELLGGNRQVIGVDIDIRAHNRTEIERHPMAGRISLIQGSSIDLKTSQEVTARCAGASPVLIILDSNHTHDHVLEELRLYSPLVSKGSYIIVMDTAVEDVPKELFADRPWGPGNNPKTAVWEFLRHNSRFVIDKDIENKLLITVAPDGFLKCIAD
jgi:cephalosporin hydroxylase